MDGTYALRHKKHKERALVALAATELTTRVPPEAEKKERFDSHAAGVKAMNATLVRLAADGWKVVDVETQSSAEEMALDRDADAREAAPPEPEELLGAVVVRHEQRVTIEVGAAEATERQAEAVLVRIFDDGCRELVINDAQPYDEPWWQTVHPWCGALGKVGGRELELFVVDTYFQPLTRQASVYCGDVTPVFARCPSLQRAHIIGDATLRELAHQRLEDLTLMTDPMRPDTARAVLRGRLPNLTRLALGLRYERAAVEGIDAVLVTALHEADLPSLRELHIAYPEDVATILRGISSAPWFAQLESLSLQGDWNDLDGVVPLLEEHALALAKLRELRLPYEYLEDELAALVAIIPGLRDVAGADAFSPKRYGAD